MDDPWPCHGIQHWTRPDSSGLRLQAALLLLVFFTERNEIKSPARLGTDHPGITASFDLEREPGPDALLPALRVLDHHGTGEHVADVVLGRLASLRAGVQRPAPSGLIDTQADCHRAQEGMASEATEPAEPAAMAAWAGSPEA